MKKIVLPELRNKMIGVKLTNSEYIEIKKICAENKISTSSFFRYLYNEYKNGK